MNEKIFHSLKGIGTAGIVTGIICIVTGITVGIISIVAGANAMRLRKHLLF